MPDPAELLAVARLLAEEREGTPPTQAQLRRAVSTAYYALFHRILRAAAERFVGAEHEQRGAYGILYRSFDHGHMRRVCEDLRVLEMKARVRLSLRRTALGQHARDFAASFPTLQEARHTADYDPTANFLPSDAASLIDVADVAIAAFDRIAADERTDILALMMVRTR